MHSNYYVGLQNQERIVLLPTMSHRNITCFYISDIFETILYELIYLVVSLKVIYLRDPGETQSVILGTFNRQLTHRRLE